MKTCVGRHEAVCKHYPRLCKKCLSFREETNADRIRGMSDKELAEGLEDWQDWGGGLSAQSWLEWLQHPVEKRKGSG